MEIDQPKIPSIDLFSGIGGFAYAFRQLATPICYCEIDPFCRSILRHNANVGNLPDAPIHDDVRTLPNLDVGRAKMITAGFPCQDISVVNTNRVRGLDGHKSSLFFEILKWIDAFDIELAVFENSPNIVKCGALRPVCDALTARGFVVRWGVFTASECGALHRRGRWYCVAFRPTFDITVLTTLRTDHLCTYWDGANEPVPRILKRTDARPWNDRAISALGNAVVPIQVVFAVKTLSTIDCDRSNACDFPSKASVHYMYTYTPRGICGTKRENYTTPITDLQLNFGISGKQWPTPTCIPVPYRKISQSRHLTVLANAIFYEKNTQAIVASETCPLIPHDKRHLHWRNNYAFVAWLMGYPATWFQRIV